MFTEARVHAILDAELAANDRLSLHTAYSATGANELAGGSYARQTITWAAAASRSKASAAAVDVPVPAGSTVAFIGVWNSAGTVFRGMVPSGGAQKTYQVDTTNERILCEGHGLANGKRVVFLPTAPAGLTVGTVYWVIGVTDADPDHFQVAATEGGAAINLTGAAPAGGLLSEIVPEVYAGDGTHRVNNFIVAL